MVSEILRRVALALRIEIRWWLRRSSFCAGWMDQSHSRFSKAHSHQFTIVHRIAVHAAQLLHSFVLRPKIEVVEACLPDRHWTALPAPPAPHEALGKELFKTLHHGRRTAHLRFAHQQMKNSSITT
jgi:hypothetical protein